MSKPKYLYIDDENGTSEVSTLNGFNDRGNIEVERFPLTNFREFGALRKELLRLSHEKAFDGLVIDLRIDGGGQDRTEFNATAITQELRSIAASGELRTFPIVLCSTEEKIKQTYTADMTSHNLFDYKVSKSNPHPDWQKITKKLESLANGYHRLAQNKLSTLEAFGMTEQSQIDKRIMERTERFSAPYDLAHFIIKDFFHQTNPLIGERILAARLGIDLKQTPPKSWESLSQGVFGPAKYTGVFSDGWERWWASKVDETFTGICQQRLTYLKAEERINFLKEKTGIDDLIAAKPLKFCNSTEFWTICEAYKTPLDPLEGYKVALNTDLKPWQENKYISLLAILEREGFADRGLKPHPSETERIELTLEELGIK